MSVGTQALGQVEMIDFASIIMYLVVCVMLAFIISFPIIALGYIVKLKKIKQNIPDDLKGGENGEEIKKKIQNRERGERSIRGGTGGRGRERGGRGTNFYPGGFAEGGRFKGDSKQQRRISLPPFESSKFSPRTDKNSKRDTKEDWPSFD